jgi:hypothetical protein
MRLLNIRVIRNRQRSIGIGPFYVFEVASCRRFHSLTDSHETKVGFLNFVLGSRVKIEFLNGRFSKLKPLIRFQTPANELCQKSEETAEN